MNDEHNIAVGVTKSVLKGALVGAIVGSTIFGPLSRYSTMFWKKSLYYMEENKWGFTRMIWQFNKPWILGGMGIFGSHYLWWNIAWRSGSVIYLI